MIAPTDVMDSAEVAEHLGVAASSIRVALTSPERHPSLARILPAPLRYIGGSSTGGRRGTPIWRRADIEAIDQA